MLRIAQFAKLALYFPLYLAIRKEFLKNFGIDTIQLVDTYGDAKTFIMLLKDEADVGLSDPIFSISEDNTPKGEIFGTLVKKIPFIAVSKKQIKIESPEYLSRYKIGTYPKFTTNNTLIHSIVANEAHVIEYNYDNIVDGLDNSEIDIAILLPEQKRVRGQKVVFEFSRLYPRFLFSGFSISSFSKKKDITSSFKLAISKSLRFIKSNGKESLSCFKQEFPMIEEHEKTFETYVDCWPEDFEIKQDEWVNSFNLWRRVYPVLFKEKNPSFLVPKQEDKILTIFTSKQFSRDYPSDIDGIVRIIKTSLNSGLKISLVGFWGASDKQNVTENDVKQIEQLKKLERAVNSYYKGIEVTFILSDMHAMINKFSKHIVSDYLHKVSIELSKNGFGLRFLSDLWKEWGLTPDLVWERAAKLDLKKYLVPIDTLQKQASKHFQGGDKVLGSKMYFAMRTLEAPYIQSLYKNSILFSYTDRSATPFLPKMPTLFFYSLGKEISEPAWFQK